MDDFEAFSVRSLAVLAGNGNRLQSETRQSLETSMEKDKLVIQIDKTDPEVMKEVIIFMYTAKCDLNEHNGESSTRFHLPRRASLFPSIRHPRCFWSIRYQEFKSVHRSV